MSHCTEYQHLPQSDSQRHHPLPDLEGCACFRDLPVAPRCGRYQRRPGSSDVPSAAVTVSGVTCGHVQTGRGAAGGVSISDGDAGGGGGGTRWQTDATYRRRRRRRWPNQADGAW